MAGSTTKKAVLQRFDKESLAGYVNPVSYLQPTGVELLSAQGNATNVPYMISKVSLLSAILRKRETQAGGSSIPGPKWRDFGFVSHFGMGK